VFATPLAAKVDTAGDLVTGELSIAEGIPFVPPDGTLDFAGRPRRLVARTTERYEAVQQRLAGGNTLAAVDCGSTTPPCAASPAPAANSEP
jgi:hypothetical protein